jgi:hypothetical protein|tara:strand:+ start:58 stop:246 length:189 start_codon:yes stop_codon:yes gene_type:complete
MTNEKMILDANYLINIIKKELPYASAGDLMDMCDLFGYEFVMVRPNEFELKEYHLQSEDSNE